MAMSRHELIERVARAIAAMEGFYLTEQECAARGISYPPLARRLCNPGNIRRWASAAGIPYPQHRGYVDFRAWASLRMPTAKPDEIEKAALDEGWRVLHTLVAHYIDGRYHGGRSPSLREMFRVYAPASDANQPDRYAEFVAKRVGVPADRPLKELIL